MSIFVFHTLISLSYNLNTRTNLLSCYRSYTSEFFSILFHKKLASCLLTEIRKVVLSIVVFEFPKQMEIEFQKNVPSSNFFFEESLNLVFTSKFLFGYFQNCFSISYTHDGRNVIEFAAESESDCQAWIQCIQSCRYKYNLLRSVLILLLFLSYNHLLSIKGELEQKYLYLSQAYESELKAKYQYLQQVEELSAEVRQLRKEVNKKTKSEIFCCVHFIFI